jgi:hypothetical protein
MISDSPNEANVDTLISFIIPQLVGREKQAFYSCNGVKNEDLVPLITLEYRIQDHWNDTKGKSNMSNKLHNWQYSIEIKAWKQIGNVPNQQFPISLWIIWNISWRKVHKAHCQTPNVLTVMSGRDLWARARTRDPWRVYLL